ncbi:MAG: PQQ-binding-like beta-propeller repeat protein, partial [Candidatus Dormibacteraeota bacterium]|nr:PQQ-binding-like beta-propeller repeat protein [Candidatus Dormibacteraeota bacterium]
METNHVARMGASSGDRRRWGVFTVLAVVATVAGSLGMTGVEAAARHGNATQAPANADWPTYLHDNARSGASTEAILNAGNAPGLGVKWSVTTGNSVVTSAAVVGGVAYFGSWDGYEYAANASTGAVLWKTNLGTTTDPNCSYPTTAGITSNATVQNGVVYVGGGDSNWYALNASNGAVLWSVFTGDNSVAGAHYNWSSPLIYTAKDGNTYAYIGIASN